MQEAGSKRQAGAEGFDFHARLDYTSSDWTFAQVSNHEGHERANLTNVALAFRTKMLIHPPHNIVWSTDAVDLSDPFQRKWYIRQVLLHGRAQDIRALDLEMVASLLEDLNLPPDLYRLWKTFLETRSHARSQAQG